MDKLISSLLCCSVDTPDQDRKVNRQQSQSTIRKTQKTNSDSTAKRQIITKPPKNDYITTNIDNKRNSSEIDNSTNESDTIIANNNQVMSHNSAHENVNVNANNLNTSPLQPESQSSQPQQDSQPSNHPKKNDLITQVDENGPLNNLHQNFHNFSNEELIDLTKIQEGQVVSKSGWLLEAKKVPFKNKKCLILDLDETLVHSSFKYLRSADFVIPVEIENQVHNVYVIKRPGVDEFIEKVGEWYEVVVFTASVARYGDPLLNKLDKNSNIHHRLFRESCYNYQGNYIKNLSQIGRPLSDLIIIDNSPASYIFHPQHSIPISSWFSDSHDNELLDLLPFLEDLSKTNVDDVSLVLDVTI